MSTVNIETNIRKNKIPAAALTLPVFLRHFDFISIGTFPVWNVADASITVGVGVLLLRQNRIYLANLNWMLGYFGMFFILVYGWDGLGFDRFFYDRDMVAGSPAWAPGARRSRCRPTAPAWPSSARAAA